MPPYCRFAVPYFCCFPFALLHSPTYPTSDVGRRNISLTYRAPELPPSFCRFADHAATYNLTLSARCLADYLRTLHRRCADMLSLQQPYRAWWCAPHHGRGHKGEHETAFVVVEHAIRWHMTVFITASPLSFAAHAPYTHTATAAF